MKYIFLILLLHITGLLQAQKTEKITWYNDELQTLVQPSHGRFISFVRRFWDDSFELTPDSVTPLAKQLRVNVYDLDFLGDQVLFEHQFGKAFPVSIINEKLESLKRKDCYLSYAEGRIYPDSIVMQIDLDCKKSDDEDKIFYPVRQSAGFRGDRPAFESLLQQGLGAKRFSVAANDSVLYLFGVVKRDSMFHDAKLLGPGEESAFSRKAIELLEQLQGWRPALKEGRIINMYRTVYIRLRPDGTIEADYERNY